MGLNKAATGGAASTVMAQRWASPRHSFESPRVCDGSGLKFKGGHIVRNPSRAVSHSAIGSRITRINNPNGWDDHCRTLASFGQLLAVDLRSQV